MGRISNYCSNNGPKITFTIFWIALNSFLFTRIFLHYYFGPEYYYLHKMLGLGLCISRASAACINLNCCLIMLPMCRNILTYVRNHTSPIFRQIRRLMDHGKSFHIACAYMIILMTVVHIGGHISNVLNFSRHYSQDYHEINVAKEPGQNPIVILLTTVPGITGILMVICLVTVVVTASSKYRHGGYKRFWITHHIFIIFFGLLLAHAASGVLKYQTNIHEHIPGCVVVGKNGSLAPEPEPEFAHPEPLPEFHHVMVEDAIDEDLIVPEVESIYPEPEMMEVSGSAEPEPEDIEKHSSGCHQPHPEFSSCSQETWMWLILPLLFYAIERLYRTFGGPKTTLNIVNVTEHPHDLIEIEFYQNHFKSKPGQTVWLRCADISAVESHPFTLTATPSESNKTFSLHMLALGDWTRDFAKRLILAKHQSNCLKQVVTSCNRSDDAILTERGNVTATHNTLPYPVVHLDGPYGSPMEDIFNYKTSLCFAGGIGVTPFASVLNILHKNIRFLENCKLQRMYLIWSCKNADSFTWLAHVIDKLQTKLQAINKPDFLNVYLHVTRASTDTERMDLNELKRCRLLYGRPNVKEYIKETSQRHRKQKVGVFCCGPKTLSEAVNKFCLQASDCKLIFNKESF